MDFRSSNILQQESQMFKLGSYNFFLFITFKTSTWWKIFWTNRIFQIFFFFGPTLYPWFNTIKAIFIPLIFIQPSSTPSNNFYWLQQHFSFPDSKYPNPC